MSRFAGLVIRDENTDEPKVFTEEAADQIMATITEPPVEKVTTDTGGFYIILK